MTMLESASNTAESLQQVFDAACYAAEETHPAGQACVGQSPRSVSCHVLLGSKHLVGDPGGLRHHE
jgi:hypothetical protein